MLNVWTIAVLVAIYMAGLFAVAFWGDRKLKAHRQHPFIYSLALGVHCTSWAFFGTTTQAVHYGWAVVPTYLGIICFMMFAFPLYRKVASICEQYNVSSLADFIALRYRNSHGLAAMVTLLCFIGVVPYLALQLDAVVNSVDIIIPDGDTLPTNIGWYVAALMALFAILFGTRTLSLTEKHPGLMLTIAFESVVKLVALTIVGLYVCYVLFDGVIDVLTKSVTSPAAMAVLDAPAGIGVYLTHMLLGALSMLCLPRQFHMNFVENNGEQELETARWVLPLYLFLMTIFVLPIGLAGSVLLDPAQFDSDSYVLALPVMHDAPVITLVGFIGGLSAATSMVIVATLAVGIMISNNVVTPLWLSARLRRDPGLTLRPSAVLLIRRLTILLVLGAGYLYHVHIGQTAPLVNSGTVALALLAQTSPALIFGLYLQQKSVIPAVTSILAGAVGWVYWLLWPSVKASYYFESISDDWVLAEGFLFSIGVNVVTYLVMSLVVRSRHQQTVENVEPADYELRHVIKVDKLFALTKRVLSESHHQALAGGVSESDSAGYASPSLVRRVESELAGQVGNVSARILLTTISEKPSDTLPELVELVEEASQTFQFNHEVLQSSVQNIEQGICVLDRDLNLLAWNDRYIELLEYPQGLLQIGMPIEELLRFNAARGMLGDPENVEEQIAKRLGYASEGSRYKFVRHQSNGRVIELNGSPLPGGGYVTTYSDITEYINIQRALTESKTELEARVTERTHQLTVANEELQQAKSAAEQAHESKSRFLAAAGHDLMQPFNAASLFASMLEQKTTDTSLSSLSEGLVNSLNSADSLLSSLLDMTRLESGVLKATVTEFCIDEVLQPLVTEFDVIAAQKGLRLRYCPSQCWVASDRKLLRRLLQNLLSNAVRYTEAGSVLIGVRRNAENINICVYDTGCGIAQADQQAIFREFHQLPSTQSEQGLGLGLTIVDGLSQLLSHPVSLSSVSDKGTAFFVSVKRVAEKQERSLSKILKKNDSAPFKGMRVLIIENDPQVAMAMQELLKDWELNVELVSDIASVNDVSPDADIIVADYHLNHGETGIDAVAYARELWGRDVPAILNSADRSDEVRELASQQGMQYLPKPVKPAALKRLFRSLLRKVAQ